MYRIDIIPKTLVFKFQAGTSRGVYTERKVWFLKLTDLNNPDLVGYGECAPLPKLSCDDLPDYELKLRSICDDFEKSGEIDYESLRPYPSILFGLETAFRNLKQRSVRLWESDFSEGKEGIPINGLIWMGTYEEMKKRIEEKLKAGFHCIKVKIGAIDFDKEFDLLQKIRREYSSKEVLLRVDANGGFKYDEALSKLSKLASLDIHSIEQPIMAGDWERMAQLCASTPLPIALDEELIGINSLEQKRRLLDKICPQYIILKPSLHGGICGSEEWISLAKERNIGYWITSALESNIGLNAIAQWTALSHPKIAQGLGTGQLFENNINMPLEIRGEKLWFNNDDVNGVFTGME